MRGKKYEINFEEKEYMDLGACYSGEKIPWIHEKDVSYKSKMFERETVNRVCKMELPILVTSKEKDGTHIWKKSKDNGIDFEVRLSEIEETLVDSNEIKKEINFEGVNSMETMIP